ncbi:adenylyl-sulfate kinase [Pedobacter sp. L105]|uniref:adenylyl-sulfate kinase n=1 Tax=Pedobacter sp. L105 TaxID=1641871 RepID=UPI00131B815C|nr:adenylyl-sulfate kinase [Pedobacter sp. L105]
MVLLLCGLSGAGKTTLANSVKKKLDESGVHTEIIDGDEYRRMLFKELGFSKIDRFENVRRLGFIASKFSARGIVTLISAINPYAEIRNELKETYPNVKTVFIDCSVEKLINRDTKGLYKRALLPEGHPDKLLNLTGINDQFDIPVEPDLYLNTGTKDINECTSMLFDFIINNKPSL